MTGASPLDGTDVLLCDLDGVVYVGPQPIPYAVQSLRFAARSRAVGYVTNNASRRDSDVAAHLRTLGLEVTPGDVVTSPQAAMRLIRQRVADGARVLVVGGDGLVFELEKAGYEVTRTAQDDPAIVVQGFAPEVGWQQLAEACYALAIPEHDGGIAWVATNRDRTIPQARGIAPGNGMFVSVVEAVVGRAPVVAGKPEREIFDEAVTRFGANRALFVGDRLDTDIAGARAAGLSSALVLTGIHGFRELLSADTDSRPDFILDDLRDLHTPYPVVTAEQGFAVVGDARVEIVGDDVQILSSGSRAVDLVRAGATAVWNCGRDIDGLRIPDMFFERRDAV